MADSDSDSDHDQAPPQVGCFPPTHWSVVINAGRDSTFAAREAFGRFYQDYLPPLRAFLRREGRTEDEAQELLHSFFEFLIERRGLAKVRPEGKFRSWLLSCLKNFLADCADKNRAIKRGGGAVHVVLDKDDDEPDVDPPHPGRTPDQEYDRHFALRFIELVMARLRREYGARHRESIFQCLLPFLLDKKGVASHAELGRQLNLNENTVSQEIVRLRQRFRTVFDEELEKLVGGRTEIEAERQFLFAALRT